MKGIENGTPKQEQESFNYSLYDINQVDLWEIKRFEDLDPALVKFLEEEAKDKKLEFHRTIIKFKELKKDYKKRLEREKELGSYKNGKPHQI